MSSLGMLCQIGFVTFCRGSFRCIIVIFCQSSNNKSVLTNRPDETLRRKVSTQITFFLVCVFGYMYFSITYLFLVLMLMLIGVELCIIRQGRLHKEYRIHSLCKKNHVSIDLIRNNDNNNRGNNKQYISCL